MKFAFVLLLISIFFIDPKVSTTDTHASRIVTTDSAQIEIFVLHDSLGLPDEYKGHIITPVCESDKCYTIEIDFYWDLIGRFIRFDTIPGGGLTKLDHIPFAKEDYLKLNAILADRNSILASYTKEALVESTRASDIDGFTGATAKAIKESVISGGVYSCFTLWHVANGLLRDSLQKITRSTLSKNLVNKLVGQQDQEINYFLINNFTAKEYASYLREVLQIIQDGSGYLPKNALEKMPKEAMRDSMSQKFFALNFAQLNYFAQVALVEKLDKIYIIEDLKLALKQNMDNRNSYKNELINHLVSE